MFFLSPAKAQLTGDVAHYAFDVDASDANGNAAPGWSYGPQWNNGVFDFNNDYIDFGTGWGTEFDFQFDFSLALRFQLQAYPSAPGFALCSRSDANARWVFGVLEDRFFLLIDNSSCCLADTIFSEPQNFIPGAYTQVVLSRIFGEYTISVNGISGMPQMMQDMPVPSGNFLLGASEEFSADYLVDAMSIFSYAMGTEQLQEWMSNSTCVLPSLLPADTNLQFCANQAPVFHVNSSDSVNTQFRWQAEFNGVFTDLFPSPDWIGVHTPNLMLSPGSNHQGRAFRCVLSNACGEVISPEYVFSYTGVYVPFITEDVSCAGMQDGQIIVNAPMGSTLQWSNGVQHQAVLSNLSSGNYTCSITLANGCAFELNAFINEPDVLTNDVQVVDVACSGGQSGQIEIFPSGGIAPYQIFWNDAPAAGLQRNNLMAGTYYYTLSDHAGCEQMGAVVVAEPLPLIATSVEQDVSCFGMNNGSSDVMVNGGTAPYFIQWMENGMNGFSPEALSPGFYSSMISDANGCITFHCITIAQPSEMTVSTLSSDVSCNGANDGSAAVNVNGGNAPYQFFWSNGESQSGIVGLTPGNYFCSVTDASGCMVQVQETILAPEPIVVNAFIHQPDCYLDQNGDIMLQVSGGSLPYQFSWNNGVNAADVHGLGAGLYSCTISDNHGCLQTQEILLDQPEKLSIDVSAIPTSICKGDSIALSINGALEYVWNGNLPNGSYITPSYTQEITVIGSNKNGCSTDASVRVEVRDCSFDEILPAQVYPNPFQEGFTFVASMEGEYHFQLFDLNGKLIFSESQTLQKSEAYYLNPVVSEGLYVLMVANGNQKQQFKVQKVN